MYGHPDSSSALPAMYCSIFPTVLRERAGVEEAVLREEGTWKRGGRFRER